MTELEKLYNSIQTLKELGAKLPDELLIQTDKLEEEIIKNEILPVVTEKIEPLLGQIQRALVLVVDYMPDEPLSVRISRKRYFATETIDLTPIHSWNTRPERKNTRRRPKACEPTCG